MAPYHPFGLMPIASEGAFDRLISSLNPEWIEQALTATGSVTVRKRKLPAEQVLWLVLGMALYRDRPIAELVERLDLVMPGVDDRTVAPSAAAQARARLGDEPLGWLFKESAQHWAHASARRHAWRGLAVYAVDGTSVRAADSHDNRAHFGSHRAPKGRGISGYPLVRVVTLMAVRSHLLAAANFGPWGAEQQYAKPLWDEIPVDSLALIDRNFLDAKILIPLERTKRPWLTRAKSSTSYRVIAELGAGDALVEMKVSSHARKTDPTLPKTWRVRAVRYQRPGFKPQTLLTSLLDAKRYPATEIVALYHERWEIELGYDEVKTVLMDSEESLRSKTPAGTRQELWAIGLVYNLVRLEIQAVADEAGVEPRRISFAMSLRLIQDEWMWLSASNSPGAIPKHLRKLRTNVARFVLPERRARSYPRAVKIKMSNYERKRPTTA
jgi:hypothetical protein